MTALQNLGRMNARLERQGWVGEFYAGVKYMMLNPHGGAVEAAERDRAGDRVVDLVRAAVTPGATLPGNWAEPLSHTQNAPQAFLSSLQGISVFDTLLKDMLVTQPRISVVIASSVLASGPIAEASIKPATQFSFSFADTDIKKAAPWVAISKEALDMSVPAADTSVQINCAKK